MAFAIIRPANSKPTGDPSIDRVNKRAVKSIAIAPSTLQEFKELHLTDGAVVGLGVGTVAVLSKEKSNIRDVFQKKSGNIGNKFLSCLKSPTIKKSLKSGAVIGLLAGAGYAIVALMFDFATGKIQPDS